MHGKGCNVVRAEEFDVSRAFTDDGSRGPRTAEVHTSKRHGDAVGDSNYTIPGLSVTLIDDVKV